MIPYIFPKHLFSATGLQEVPHQDDQEWLVDFRVTFEVLDVSSFVRSAQLDLLKIVLNDGQLLFDPLKKSISR